MTNRNRFVKIITSGPEAGEKPKRHNLPGPDSQSTTLWICWRLHLHKSCIVWSWPEDVCSCHRWWTSGFSVCFVFSNESFKGEKGENTFFSPFPVVKPFYSDFPLHQNKGFSFSKTFCSNKLSTVKSESYLVDSDGAVDDGSWVWLHTCRCLIFSI